MHSDVCVCACTCKWNTILHVPCICHVTSCETHPTITMPSSSHHAPGYGCGYGGRVEMYIHNTLIIHYTHIQHLVLMHMVLCILLTVVIVGLGGSGFVWRAVVMSLSHCNGVHVGRSTGWFMCLEGMVLTRGGLMYQTMYVHGGWFHDVMVCN